MGYESRKSPGGCCPRHAGFSPRKRILRAPLGAGWEGTRATAPHQPLPSPYGVQAFICRGRAQTAARGQGWKPPTAGGGERRPPSKPPPSFTCRFFPRTESLRSTQSDPRTRSTEKRSGQGVGCGRQSLTPSGR